MRNLCLLALILVLSACKAIKVENGEVPDDYRAMAQGYMGTYAGTLDGVSASVTLTLDGRKVLLSYKDANGTDMIGAPCDSKIGNLQTVSVSKTRSLDASSPVTYKLDSATFAFDPNRCWGSVSGREVVLDFSRKAAGHIRVGTSILINQEFQRDCRIDPGNPRSGVPPHEVCDQVPKSIYSSGHFLK
jgi:hypothetical protein